MSDTAQHTMLEALVALWESEVDCPVYDGPNATEEAEYAAVWVGYDPTSDTAEAVEVEQAHADIGARNKNEAGVITCCAAAWSGDTNTKPRRQRIAGILSQLEASLRERLDHVEELFTEAAVVLTDLNFGERITLHQQLTDDGNEVFAVFTVRYSARI